MESDEELGLSELIQTLESLLKKGRAIDVQGLAERFALPADDVEACLGALQALSGEPPSASQDDYGHYEALEEIGRGGMGRVFRGRHKKSQEDVAIKVMSARRPGLNGSLSQRFAREARLLGRLRHRNIVALRDFGSQKDRIFLILDYVPGCHLAELVRREGVLNERRTLTWGRTLARVLEYIHGEGVIHRDLKPQNILVDKEGQLRVADFGLARELRMDRSEQTKPGQFLGTFDFVAPEQAGGRLEDVDERSDLYSLAGTLFFLLTGAGPFSRIFSELERHSQERSLGSSWLFREKLSVIQEQRGLSKLGEFRPELRGSDIESWIQRALARNVQKRPQSAKDVSEELERLLGRLL